MTDTDAHVPMGTVHDMHTATPRTVQRDFDTALIPAMRVDLTELRRLRSVLDDVEAGILAYKAREAAEAAADDSREPGPEPEQSSGPFLRRLRPMPYKCSTCGDLPGTTPGCEECTEYRIESGTDVSEPEPEDYDPFGPEAYKRHRPGCVCWDCKAARETDAATARGE